MPSRPFAKPLHQRLTTPLHTRLRSLDASTTSPPRPFATPLRAPLHQPLHHRLHDRPDEERRT